MVNPHNIGKRQQPKRVDTTSAQGRDSTTSPPSPQPPTEQGIWPERPVTRVLQALHQGYEKVVGEIVSCVDLSEQDQVLVKGANAAWFGDPTAIDLLNI